MNRRQLLQLGGLTAIAPAAMATPVEAEALVMPISLVADFDMGEWVVRDLDKAMAAAILAAAKQAGLV